MTSAAYQALQAERERRAAIVDAFLLDRLDTMPAEKLARLALQTFFDVEPTGSEDPLLQSWLDTIAMLKAAK